VAAQTKPVLYLAAVLLLAACNSTSVNLRTGEIPNATNCRPTSAIADEIAGSQMACHQGIAGDGVQVLISNANRRASVRSDKAEREMTSIFIRPASAIGEAGPVRFDAFYSQGLFDLRGKTGCVGVLEDGTAEIKKSANTTTLHYKLQFRLVSPLGWPEDCKEPHRIAGAVEL
jgi:hypothetical protein